MKHASMAAFAAASALSTPRALAGFRLRADGDPGQVLAELNRAFAEFKEKNDARLTELEKRGVSDVVTTEHVERINAAIDELNTKLAALQLNGGAAGAQPQTPETRAYAAAFNTWFRRGNGAEALQDLAVKAQMTVGSDPDGGYMAPFEMEQAIERVLMKVSAMRNVATVMPITAATYKKLFSLGGASTGWVGETEARDATVTPKLSEMEFVPGEIYAEPFASQALLDDAYVNLPEWLANEVSISFAEQEGAGFITGNGVKKPRGLFTYDTLADADWVWGKLGFVVSGDANTIPSPDCLTDVTQTIKQGYRNNSTWLMNRYTAGVVRKLKDGVGQYLWQPPVILGQAASLLGYPIADDDNIPDVAANAYPIAFGDFRRGYLIVDRMGVRVLRDPFTNKPFIGFYTTKRVGGGVQNFEAIKLLKISA
jgi:HK97 family phage major capsid protein